MSQDQKQDETVEPWASIKALLDNCPYSVRSRYKGGEEDLLGSLCITFIGMKNDLVSNNIPPHGGRSDYPQVR